MKTYTHNALVDLARRFLIGQKCNIVITEMASGAGQEPDAIGWPWDGWSILIECKASRADFLSDKKKGTRMGGVSMGAYRYYLAPRGLIDISELPNGWGLLEPYGKGAGKRMESRCFGEYSTRNEALLLISAMRRLKFTDQPGIRVRQYQIIGESANRATLGIRTEDGK